MFNYYHVSDPISDLNKFVDTMEDFYKVLDNIDLKDYNGSGMEFNMSTVCNDGQLDVGINYKDSKGKTFNTQHSGKELSDVVDECLADIMAAAFGVDQEEDIEPQADKEKIAELEARIAELEADLKVARARNEKNVNEKFVKNVREQELKNNVHKHHNNWKGIFGV